MYLDNVISDRIAEKIDVDEIVAGIDKEVLTKAVQASLLKAVKEYDWEGYICDTLTERDNKVFAFIEKFMVDVLKKNLPK